MRTYRVCPLPPVRAADIMPFGITAALNVSQFVIGFCFLSETLPPELRVPFRTDTFNTIKQSGILWLGPTGISDKRFFRRLAFTVFVQGIGMDGCFLVIGFYIKQQFAISKNENTMMMEVQGIAAIFVMWVLYKPLIVNLGEMPRIYLWRPLGFGLCVPSFDVALELLVSIYTRYFATRNMLLSLTDGTRALVRTCSSTH
jgi:hypothetical protein